MYDTPGSLTGTFSALTRKFKFELEALASKKVEEEASCSKEDSSSANETNDIIKKPLKVETLASVVDLNHFLIKTVRHHQISSSFTS